MRNYKYILLAGIVGVTVLATGCSSWQRGDGERTAGRVVDDKRITSNIQDRLEDEPVYKFNDVDVRTYQGVVQLSGFVKTEDQKQRAGRIAEQTPGVARVVNSIVLKPEGQDTLTPTGRESGMQQQQEQQERQRELQRENERMQTTPSDTNTLNQTTQ